MVAHANWIDGHDAKHRAFVEKGLWFCNVCCCFIASNACSAIHNSRNSIDGALRQLLGSGS